MFLPDPFVYFAYSLPKRLLQLKIIYQFKVLSGGKFPLVLYKNLHFIYFNKLLINFANYSYYKNTFETFVKHNLKQFERFFLRFYNVSQSVKS